MRRRKKVSEDGIGAVVSAAQELSELEEEQKEEDRRTGRRSDLDDLPQGHPLRLMMEEAKRRLESREDFESQQEAFAKSKKAKKAKRAEQNKQEAREAHEDRKRIVSQFNKEIDVLSADIMRFGKRIKDVADHFEGFPSARVKLVRLNRLMAASYKGLLDSKISTQNPEEEL